MAKTVIIGAGSRFGAKLSIDIMANPGLRDSEICLCDLHEGRLEGVTTYVRRTAEQNDVPVTTTSSTDRRELLPDADFVVSSIAVGGGAYYGSPFREEIEIPRKYGVEQRVADTCGVGGVFRFLRTAPVQMKIAADMEDLCPDAILLNHTNPMSMLSWLHDATSEVAYVGLCHSVQHTISQLCRFVDVPEDQVIAASAGINHLAWILELRRGKEDLYSAIEAAVDSPTTDAQREFLTKEAVRVELMRQFGFFPTESSRHNSEYVPYFGRTKQMRDEYNLEPRELLDTRKPGTAPWETGEVGTIQVSREYTTGIMAAVVENTPFRFNGNVPNAGLITNLPDGCCVEVPCLVDGTGVRGCHVGDLPPQLAAIDRTNVSVHELAVLAVLERDPEAAFHACAVDPLTASIVSLPDLRSMFEELWEAEEPLLEYYSQPEMELEEVREAFAEA